MQSFMHVPGIQLHGARWESHQLSPLRLRAHPAHAPEPASPPILVSDAASLRLWRLSTPVRLSDREGAWLSSRWWRLVPSRLLHLLPFEAGVRLSVITIGKSLKPIGAFQTAAGFQCESKRRGEVPT